MGITERRLFEDEEAESTEQQLEDTVSIQDRVYRRGYRKGYSDGVKEQKEKMEHLNNITLEYEKEVFKLQALLKEQKEEIRQLRLAAQWNQVWQRAIR